MKRLTRRQVLTGSAATVGAVAIGMGLAKDRILDRDCGPDGPVPVPVESHVETGSIESTRLSRPAGWSMLWPPGLEVDTPAPVCVCLHGRGASHRQMIDDVLLDRFVAAAGSPFALAAIDGGDLYWHGRADGQDPLMLLLDEFLPLCASRGLGAGGTRAALLGWSMGGYGALLAAQTRPDLFAAVVAVSPAVSPTRDGIVADAFDSDADFAAHDVFTGADRLRDIKVRIDCGRDDPFYGAARQLADRVQPPPATDFTEGCHDSDYWRRVAPAEVDFVAAAL